MLATQVNLDLICAFPVKLPKGLKTYRFCYRLESVESRIAGISIPRSISRFFTWDAPMETTW